jgi:hypothetical protein
VCRVSSAVENGVFQQNRPNSRGSGGPR